MYPVLETEITDIFAALNNIGIFKKIDIWNNQIKFEKSGKGYSFPTPAIFLEMQQAESKQLGMGVNLVYYNMIFHICDIQLNYTKYLDRNLKVFDLRNSTKDILNQYRPSRMGKLSFIKDEQQFDHTNIYHYILTFKAPLVDQWGNTYPTLGTASIDVTVGFTASIN